MNNTILLTEVERDTALMILANVEWMLRARYRNRITTALEAGIAADPKGSCAAIVGAKLLEALYSVLHVAQPWECLPTTFEAYYLLFNAEPIPPRRIRELQIQWLQEFQSNLEAVVY